MMEIKNSEFFTELECKAMHEVMKTLVESLDSKKDEIKAYLIKKLEDSPVGYLKKDMPYLWEKAVEERFENEMKINRQKIAVLSKALEKLSNLTLKIHHLPL